MNRVKAKTGIKAWLEYAACRSAFATLQLFPLNWNLKLARLIAGGWPLVAPRHRQRAIDHLQRSFNGEFSQVQIEQFADRCLAHLTMWAVELASAPRLLTPTTWPRYIRLGDFSEAMDLLLAGKGVIMVTPHFGNFELPAYLLACLGFDISAVMRPLDNVYLNRFLVRSRRAHGLKLVAKKGATSAAPAILEGGAGLAFVADQDAGRKGIFVDFFGRPASTYKSIGLLAMLTKRPIVVGYARRIGDGFFYEVGVKRIIYPHEWEQRDNPLRWITATYMAAFEEIVREDPGQYLWPHRRWKTRPKGELAESSGAHQKRPPSPVAAPEAAYP